MMISNVNAANDDYNTDNDIMMVMMMMMMMMKEDFGRL